MPLNKAARMALLRKYWLKNAPHTFAAGPKKHFTYMEGSAHSRSQLLRKVYEKSYLNDEYKQCNAWYDYFKPFELTQLITWQNNNMKQLCRIDAYEKHVPHNMSDRLHILLSHQSMEMEGYALNITDSQKIFEALKHATHSFTDRATFQSPPAPETLLDVKHADMTKHVIMFRNVVLAHQFVMQNLNQKLTMTQLRFLNHIILKDLLVLQIAENRTTAMKAKGTFHTIYPFPCEIPSLMSQLIAQHNSEMLYSSVHPFLYCCHFYATLLHIHPFQDGNGRLARAMFAGAMVRLGYTPIVFQDFERDEYLEALYLYDQKQPNAWLSMHCDAFDCNDE